MKISSLVERRKTTYFLQVYTSFCVESKVRIQLNQVTLSHTKRTFYGDSKTEQVIHKNLTAARNSFFFAVMILKLSYIYNMCTNTVYSDAKSVFKIISEGILFYYCIFENISFRQQMFGFGFFAIKKINLFK